VNARVGEIVEDALDMRAAPVDLAARRAAEEREVLTAHARWDVDVILGGGLDRRVAQRAAREQARGIRLQAEGRDDLGELLAR
jgi:hypothetical protein